jgi:hypothetical protein
MKPFIRFGRRVAVPATVQILHDLMAFSAEEDCRERCAEADGLSRLASWDAIRARRAALATAG